MLKLTLLLAATIAVLLLTGCPKNQGAAGQTANVSKHTPSKVVQDNTGLPMRLILPPEAQGEDDLDLLPPSLGSGKVTWSTTFAYAGGFDVLVKDIEHQLKPQHYSRISGPPFDQDVTFTATTPMKPTSALGKKVWISADRRILLSLTFTFKRATKDHPELDQYDLTALKTDTSNKIEPASRIVPLK